MRVITGKAKGRKLQMVPGDTTRPITDRAKEALFSILGDWIVDARVLDLFAGTGGVGIECLSRGAKFAHFIDANRNAIETVTANLKNCKLESQAVVQRADSFAFLEKYHGTPFDLIFVAPPQYQNLWRKTLELLDSQPALLAKFGAVVVQIHPREETPLALTRLQEYDRRKYGSVMFLFYAASEDLQDEEEDEAWEDTEGEAEEFDTEGEDEEFDEELEEDPIKK